MPAVNFVYSLIIKIKIKFKKTFEIIKSLKSTII